MTKQFKTDLCIIGAGAAGLTVAAVAAQLDVPTVIIEANKMGGDCLNYGCIPSKSLLAAAKAAYEVREAKKFGVNISELSIDFSQVMAHVQSVIDHIAVNDSAARFEKLGATVITANAKFIAPDTLQAGDTLITARRFVIAAGSSPFIAPITGIETTPYLTNETILQLKAQPQHLLIIGGGPIGCEFAQAFAMLGSKVTMFEGHHILPHDDAELVNILRGEFIKHGINLIEETKILKVTHENNTIQVIIEKNGQTQTIEGSHLLVATGRKANVDKLNLAAANIAFSAKGITVDDTLRSTNHHVYAIGDIAGSYQFTHIASYHAEIVIRNILFRLPTKVNYSALPWVTYTEPELAHVGLTLKTAKEKFADAYTISWPFSENDRAQTECTTIGKINVLVNKKGLILGASILGPHAGELLWPWIKAIQNKETIHTMTGLIVPYPTLSEINKRVAGQFYAPKLFSRMTKMLVRFLRIFG